MTQEMGAATMDSTTDPPLQNAVTSVLEHLAEMVGMDTVSHAGGVELLSIINVRAAAYLPMQLVVVLLVIIP
jgi:hypothetical protein